MRSSAACALCEDDLIMPGDLPPQIVEFANEDAAKSARGTAGRQVP